jgi:hypothetical protein
LLHRLYPAVRWLVATKRLTTVSAGPSGKPVSRCRAYTPIGYALHDARVIFRVQSDVQSQELGVQEDTMNEQIKVYGTPWCPDCRRSKQFLGEMRIPYEWIDIDQDEAAAAFVREKNDGK